MVRQIQSKADFEQFAKDSPIAVVDFYAMWCGPCRMIAPVIEEMETEFNKALPGKMSFCKVDVDVLTELAAEMNIRAMPTFQIYFNGELHDTIVGANVEKIKGVINELVGKLENES